MIQTQRNGVGGYDNNSKRRVFDAAVEQLRRAMELKQNCQVVYNIGRDGSIKAKITLDIDLDVVDKTG